MTLVFRNVDAVPDAPVEAWPPEAIATALARGELSHWRRIAAAVRREPWGHVAGAVEAAVEMDEPYGIGGLLREVVDDARRDAVASLVRRAIDESGLSIRRLAGLAGTSPSRLSTYASGRVVPRADVLFRLAAVTGHEIGLVPAGSADRGDAGDRRPGLHRHRSA